MKFSQKLNDYWTLTKPDGSKIFLFPRTIKQNWPYINVIHVYYKKIMKLTWKCNRHSDSSSDGCVWSCFGVEVFHWHLIQVGYNNTQLFMKSLQNLQIFKIYIFIDNENISTTYNSKKIICITIIFFSLFWSLLITGPQPGIRFASNIHLVKVHVCFKRQGSAASSDTSYNSY